MFTYEWLGTQPEHGVPKVFNRSVTSSNNLNTAIARAKFQLKQKVIFPGGETHGVRIFNNRSILVWAGNVNDA